MNPFSTRHIRPGALAYIFPPDQSAAALVEQLRASGWKGQIIGPHGSGKSTLVAAPVPAIEATGRTALLRQIRAEAQPDAELMPSLDESTQLILDGYEQLSWWARRRIDAACRRHGAGLLITAHKDMGLPTLLTTRPTYDLCLQVVAQLLGPDHDRITETEVQQAWDAASGNLRETLFKLYDVYQNRRG